MGVRTSVDLAIQVGFDNGLDDLAFDRNLSEVLDTMEDVQSGSGSLAAGVTNRQLDLGDVQQGRLLYVEADGPLEVYINGALPTAAQVDGAGAAFPTGFVGGETFIFTLDGTPITVTFDAADQAIADVVNRINSAAALAGFSTPVASDNGGQIRLTSPTTGSTSTLASFGGTAQAALGFAAAIDTEGVDPVPNTASWSLRRMADANGTQVSTLKAYMLASVLVSSLFISNLSADVVSYRWVVVGDLSDPLAAC